MSVRVMFSYRGSKLLLQFHYLFTAALHRYGRVLFFISSIFFLVRRGYASPKIF